MVLWILWGSATTTTTATSRATTTATATTERFFEALRVNCSVFLSTDRGWWYYGFCGFFCGSSTTTTTATSKATATATATTERLFGALRVNDVEVLLRFGGGSTGLRIFGFFLRIYGGFFLRFGSVQWCHWWCSGLQHGFEVLSERKINEGLMKIKESLLLFELWDWLLVFRR